MKHRYVAAAALLVLAGCAKPPSAIAPSYVSDVGFKALECNELSHELARINQQLPPLEQQQKNASTGDAVGVFLVGIPVSSLGGGDVEGQIARLRGERQTIENVMRSKGC